MRGIALLLVMLAFASGAETQSATQSTMPSDSEIRQILVDRIDVQHQSVGIVVGVIAPDGRRIVAYGHLDKDDPRPLNGNTVFEIGSVTKVFTSLLLADMVQRGEVALDDPVSKYLPPNVKMPKRDGRSITLVDLATHTSGLPRLPTNLQIKNPSNPYTDYTVADLYQFLSSYQLARDPGSQYEYSNLGVGLLGHVLALRAGMSYEALVTSRICDPLDMKETRITLTPEMKARMAVGHNASLAPVSNWDLPTLAGAGALRSTANDMLTFLAANLGYVKSPLAPAMAEMLKVRRPTGQPGLETGLAWLISTRNGREIVWHNGGTGGFRSFVGFDPKARVGVVVLSNTFTTIGVDDIGMHLLDPNAPLAVPQELDQKPATPGTEEAVRQLIQWLTSGKPDYNRMVPALAQATQQQLPILQPALAQMGALESLKFMGVDAQGQDTYISKFQHGSLEWHLSLAPDGRIASAVVRPAQ